MPCVISATKGPFGVGDKGIELIGVGERRLAAVVLAGVGVGEQGMGDEDGG